jgi:GTP cyclohydrolase II
MHVPDRVIRPHAIWQASAEVPTRYGRFETHVFTVTEPGTEGAHADGACTKEHVALVFGHAEELRGASDVYVRVHSECITSEVFNSLKCDCKEQLDAAMAEIGRRGRGMILYLRQEGRGIGLVNKIKAYGLQSKGHDTVDANRLLGLPDDAREYDAAKDMLDHFGVKSIVLMTNNPEKVNKLTALGVKVSARQPVLIAPNRHSAGYLEAKRVRMAHELPKQVGGARVRPTGSDAE